MKLIKQTIFDYIDSAGFVLKKKNYETTIKLEEDLRFDWGEFVLNKNFVNKKKINEMLTRYKSYRLQRILKDMRKRL